MPDAALTSGPPRAPLWPLVGLALYFALIVLQASLLAPSGRSDDTETLLLSQSLAWGYESKNPPAFYWLAWLVTGVAGPGLPVIYALRLAGVFAAFVGLYAIARRLQPDPLLAACAGFAMLATLHFHWYVLFYLTNTSLAMALGPLAVLALFHLRDRPTLVSYALFGAVIGLGILSRYNFLIFAVALIAAGLAARDWRALLLRPTALVGVLVAGLLIMPHVVWVWQHWDALAGAVRGQIVGGEAPAYAARALTGLSRLVNAVVSILLAPLGIMAAIFFPQAFRPIAIADPERASGLALLRRLVLVCLGLMVVYVAAGASYLRPHHLFFLAFAPLWLIARLDRGALRPGRPKSFAIGLAACAGLAAIAYPFENLSDAKDCDACEEFQPIDRYAAALRDAGFERGTILTLARRQDFPAAALRRFFPEARLVSFDYPVYAPPPNRVSGDCLLVWSGASTWPRAWAAAPDGPIPRLGVPLPDTAVLGTVTGAVHLSGREAVGMRFALIPGGVGDCR